MEYDPESKILSFEYEIESEIDADCVLRFVKDCTQRVCSYWNHRKCCLLQDSVHLLQLRVRRIHPDIADNCVLDHDNAPVHTALVSAYLARMCVATLSYPLP